MSESIVVASRPLTPEEAGAMMGYSKYTIMRMANRGEGGGRLLVRELALQNAVQSGELDAALLRATVAAHMGGDIE